MNKTIQQRLEALRQQMKKNAIDAFIIPSNDPHMSEYPSEHWKCREWISGFDGSAGTVVVTADNAGLWTDSRYFLQADIQLNGTGISLFKEGLPETPSIEDFLIQTLPEGATVAVDGNLFSVASTQMLRKRFSTRNISLNTHFFPYCEIWENRPLQPKDPMFVYPEKFAGESALSKRERILKALAKDGANALLMTTLDDIAWALNIRGTDVECNPVTTAYAFLSDKENIIFIDKDKLTDEARAYFDCNNILIASYDKVDDFLKNLSGNYCLLIDPDKVSDYLFSSINPACKVIQATAPVALLKAVKNSTEIAGFHDAMKRDGVALVRFFRWLEKAIPTGTVTEKTVAEKLIEFRSQQDLFVGESFSTIAGFRGHGAIVHYHVTDESNVTITNNGFLLIDSGAQYFDGTTDITRTIILGKPTEEEKKHFTLVLKGHINLGMSCFPQGTRGDQLDAIARRYLWDLHLNYLHGTGHGIGHFLSVHEGPQNIRLNHNPTTLMPGMVTSNEPGLYITDKYGIRHENLVLTVEDGESEFGKFYRFETLTLCPFDQTGIDASLLSPKEIEWLNKYHQTVYEKLAPALNEEEKVWLAEKTKAI